MFQSLSAASGLAALKRVVAAAAFAAASVFCAASAQAGDPVKLLIELPPDVANVNCGEAVDLQIVGEDAAKTRVGFSGKTVEVSATYGTIEVIKQPYQFRFRAPATLPDITNVRIRAWLKEAPEVSGETTVPVIPPAPFKRLVLQGAGSTPAGAMLDIFLRGETPTGALTEVPEGTVTLTVTGPGKLTLVKTSRYRFETDMNASGTARIVATLNRYPQITGTLDILVTGGGGGAATPPSAGGTTPTPGQPQPPVVPVPPVAPGGVQNPPPPPVTPAPPAVPTAPGTAKPLDDDNADAVVWTSGAVRLETWRLRDTPEAAWTPIDRKLPAKGSELVANRNIQKIRVGVIAAKVAKVEVEEWSGDKGGAITQLKPTKDGRFVLVERKDGMRVVHYELTMPEGNRPMSVAIIVTTTEGKVTRDEFTFRRSEGKK